MKNEIGNNIKLGTHSGRNCSIDLFRLLCAIFVVAIHTKLFFDINSILGYSVKHVITRIAVPFFFCVMGYYYIKKLINNEKPFKKNFIRYLKVYVVWSVIYYVFNLIFALYQNTSFLTYTLASIENFFIWGTNSYHLWFFPAVFFCLIVVTVCYKLKLLKPLVVISIVLYIITTLGSAYPQFAKNVPILSKLILWNHYDKIIRHFFGNALAFFCMGYLFNVVKIKKNNKKDVIIEIMLIIIFVIENIYIYKYMKPEYQSITFSLYPLLFQTMKLLFNNPMNKLQKISDKTKHIADFTYYSHVLFRDIFTFILTDFFHLNSYYTILFLSTIITTILIGYLLFKYSKSTFVRKFII